MLQLTPWLGLRVGLRVGVPVGLREGDSDGVVLGVVDGKRVGFLDKEGLADGDIDGNIE
jgi:hypothetical protein